MTFPAGPFINEAVAIRRCPYCKAIIDESQKYCNNCGTQLLFPEDESNEEPIKGEKILDEDFKDDDENRGFDEPADDKGLEREDIDLEAVLKGAGHFPDEAAASTPADPLRSPDPSAPARVSPPPVAPAPKPAAAEPDVPKRPPRPRKKPEPSIPKSDTREEIARLIAALEEKEKKSAPEPESKAPLNAAFNLPEPGPPGEFLDLPDKELLPEPASEPTSWETLLKKPATVDLENGPLPGDFLPVDEPESDEPPALEGPPANPTAGDTMDFEEELYRRTPPAIVSPTRMGIPERVAGESTQLPSLNVEKEPQREKIRRSLFDEEIPAAVPVDAGSYAEEETPARRLGFFRKIGALFFDLVFIGAVCLGSLWLAARLMDVALFDLISIARVAAGLYCLSLLFGYFFLFLFFLGETLGDRLASPRS